MGDADNTAEDSTLLPALATGSAPPYRAAAAPRVSAAGAALAPGETFGDFTILRLLGSGTFAQVFLARQLSLDRLVALKVTAHQGEEARTLANLEHDNIVQVFAEQVHPQWGLRLLCMQYVAGLTLAQVIQALQNYPPDKWSGRQIVNILDELAHETAVLDPAALEGRNFLQGCDFPAAVCWLGTRLAEALAHAHGQGVLHRDVKPANILLNRYGRPFLADFNIAQVSTRVPRDGSGSGIAGTLGYMAPEHLEAFLVGSDREGHVDARSDLYGLGVVLHELLTGDLPFRQFPDQAHLKESLAAMLRERRASDFSPRAIRPEVPELLDRTIRRCLSPNPEQRYPTAVELAQALEGCRTFLQSERALPPPGPVARWVVQRPGLTLALLTLIPHFLGSAVNIPYNALRIVEELTAAQKLCFERLVWVYNLVVYPLCIGLLGLILYRAVRSWSRVRQGVPQREQMTAARRQLLHLPAWAIGLSCSGWLPGALLFPVCLHLFSDPVPVEEFSHFLVSFTISGLIAMTYSYFGVQYAVVRGLLPHLWCDGANLHAEVRHDLAGVPQRLRLFQLLAGLIPLAGAMLMVTVGSDELTTTFRVLVTALIALGMAGFGMALFVSNRISRVLAAFLGANTD